MSTDLARLAADPSCVEDLGPDVIPALLGDIEALRVRLLARLMSVSAPAPPAPDPPRSNGGPDHLLTADEVARRLGISRRSLYRRAASLPFTRRIGTNTLRFSSRGLERWVASR